jgi:hypothetical protein
MLGTEQDAIGFSMTERAKQLYTTADGQIAELIDLISTLDETALGLPCPGREKLGDGTLGAAARHTTDSYARIAAFAQASGRMPTVEGPAEDGGDRRPRFLGRIGHGPADHAAHGPASGQRRDQHAADNTDVDVVVTRLAAARGALGAIAELTDSQLNAVPPKDSFRFCDGQRTVEQVLAALLKHQSHQVAALQAARP